MVEHLSDAEQGDYLVVARRYRPQAFDELIGQEHVAQALKQAIAAGRVGHAYLFTGARGVGKTSAARILAKALNCTASDGPTATPCGECDLCLAVAGGDDVDVIEIDGASNRGIDEIRQLRQNVAVRPSRSRFKIYIIDEVHMLTKEAFNALLKTLEEPPEHVKFLFATTEPNKIPITILSRCQRFDFAGIESGSIRRRLRQIAEAEGVAIDEEALQVLAMRAAGSMRDSQSLLEQLLAIASGSISGDDVNALLGVASAQRVAELAHRVVDRDAAAALAELDAAIAGGADPGQLIDQLLGYFRDVMTLCVGGTPDRLLFTLPGQADEAAAIGQRLGVATVLALLQVFDQTTQRMRVSLHTRTLAEMAIVRAATLDDLDDLAGLIAEVRSGAPTTPPSAPAAGRSTPPRQPPRQAAPSQPPPRQTPSRQTPPSQSPPPQSAASANPPPRQSVEPPISPSEGHPPTAGGADGMSLAEQMNAQLTKPRVDKGGGGVPANRKTRRQQLAEVAKNPLVEAAMQLFDVPPDKLRYTPGEESI